MMCDCEGRDVTFTPDGSWMEGFYGECAACGFRFHMTRDEHRIWHDAPKEQASTPLAASDLKPCPFCGGKPERVDIEESGDPNFGGSCVCCQQCGASSPVHFDRKENLEDSWNRRVPIPTPV